MTENKNETAGYESIRRFFHNLISDKKVILNILGGLFMIYTLLLLVRICMSTFGNVSVPNEYREAANIQLTKAFMDGINPYRLSAYEGELPGMIYVYGPLYSLFTAVLGKLLPFVDLIMLHYLVTFCSVLISGALSAYMVFKRTKNPAACAAVFLFIINCSWRYGYINAVPDAFALMIYILIIFLISLDEGRKADEGSEKTQSKNKTGKNILYAVLSVSLFFVKQYFAVIIPAILVFKFINDRKDALKFFISCTAVSIVVFITVSVTCPLYWTYSIYLAHGPFGITQEQYNKAYGGYMGLNDKADPEITEETEAGDEKGPETEDASAGEDAEENADLKTGAESFTSESVNTDPKAGFGYEIMQLKSLGGIFIFIFTAAFWGVLSLLLKRPLEKSSFSFFLIILMVMSSVALLYLGRNDGAWLSYYLQLLMPEVIIFAFIFISGVPENGKVPVRITAFCLLVCMMFFTAFRTNGRLKVYDKTIKQSADWERAYEIASEYAGKGEVYYIPLLGFQTFYNGQDLYNNGHSMVITGWFKGEYFAVPWEQFVFPYGKTVMPRHYDYQEKIKEKAASKEYSLVTIIDGTDTDFGRLSVGDLVNDGYKKIDSILLNVGRMSYEVQFWVPE